METVNDTIRLLNQGIRYLKEQKVGIAALLVAIYVWQNHVGPRWRSHRQATPLGGSTTHRDEEMRLVRERQQQIADQRAKEAAANQTAREKERKTKAAAQTESRKPTSRGGGGDRLGGSSIGGYNPLMPHTASSGPSYRYVEIRVGYVGRSRYIYI